MYLRLNDIEHRNSKVGRPQTNGFVERFNRTVLDEFFWDGFRRKLYEPVEALQQDLDGWLDYYSREQPHQGYRIMERRPIEWIDEYLQDEAPEGPLPARSHPLKSMSAGLYNLFLPSFSYKGIVMTRYTGADKEHPIEEPHRTSSTSGMSPTRRFLYRTARRRSS